MKQIKKKMYVHQYGRTTVFIVIKYELINQVYRIFYFSMIFYIKTIITLYELQAYISI